MPRKPSNSGFRLNIDDDFDENQSYRVKLYDLVEGPSTYAGAKPGEISMTWKLNIYRADGTAFEDTQKGEIFEVWAFSSDSTFGTSKGRAFTEAFAGRKLTDEEVDALVDNGFREAMVGKTALGSFQITTNENGDERLKVLLLRPDKPARSARAVEPEAEPEPVAARGGAPRGRRIDDD